ncbi:hypothetical protein BCR32DRAFT_280608 [Anaeromyces robustus]|uniref:Uncharacterized protein n=1 Tax=Anaeromyces robustus TaxID=1754192 RepID=A0A1Y1X3H7_9FUNG|nr:hypothetical protein BCR32DRAFT_280608 [Anaeromyces robustus]|eukprot:ORX80333.1 hypothetical protein BCR32DRAFT_280608 [Anaeromyces robustus]
MDCESHKVNLESAFIKRYPLKKFVIKLDLVHNPIRLPNDLTKSVTVNRVGVKYIDEISNWNIENSKLCGIGYTRYYYSSNSGNILFLGYYDDINYNDLIFRLL